MDWQVKSPARESAFSGKPFEAGQVLMSVVYLDATAGVARADVHVDELVSFAEGRTVLGWWRTKAQVRDASDGASRKQIVFTTEALFLALYGVGDDSTLWDEAEATAHGGTQPRLAETPEGDALKFLLALMLERKRVLRALERPHPEHGQRYLHVKSRREFHVPAVDMTPELMLSLQAHLKELV